MRNMEPAHFHQPHMRSRRPPAARCDAETANVVHPWPAHTTYPWAATGGTMRDTLSGESGKTLLPEITGYTLLRAIGHGGMSTVYLGEQVSLRSEEPKSELQSLMRISYAVFCLQKNKI